MAQSIKRTTQVQLDKIFRNGMMLQREKPLTIWGTALPGIRIYAEIQNRNGSCISDDQGRWEICLEPLQASMDEKLTICWDGGMISLTDIAVGELWLAGGQSNMEFQLCFEKHFDEEKDLPENRNIRFYDVPKISYDGQDQDFDYSSMGVWRTANSQERKYYSAVGYYFAKDLHEHLNVPVGIIGCNWGGTTSSAWMNKESVRELDNYWWHKFCNKSKDLDWEAYYRTQKAEPLNDCGNLTELYFNKVMMPVTVTPEEARVLLKEVPIPDFEKLRPIEIPGALYAHMLVPVSKMAVRGVLWYQGESDDETDGVLYETMLRTLIRDWRNLWNDTLPFLIVQLPGWESWLFQENQNYAVIRKSQERVADDVHHVFLCSISDIGEQFDIHPKEKRSVGQRLSLLARGHIYGEELLCDPPRAVEIIQAKNCYDIFFSNASEGLEIKGEEIADLKCLREGREISREFELREDVLRIKTKEPCDRIQLGTGKWICINLYNKAGLPAVPFDFHITDSGWKI